MFIDLIRLSSQHRTFCCYSILSLWIVLLIIGMYKYMPSNPHIVLRRLTPNDVEATAPDAGSHHHHFRPGAESASGDQSMLAECSSMRMEEDTIGGGGGGGPDRLTEEGGLFADWQLLGVLAVIRHGDRGPMAHVRGVNAIDCGVTNLPAVERYRAFLVANSSATGSGGGGSGGSASAAMTGGNGPVSGGGVGRPAWTKSGAFHGNPLLPAFARSCLLGQLTYKGIAQLLHTGQQLRRIYGVQLQLYSNPNANPKAAKSANASSSSGSSSGSSGIPGAVPNGGQPQLAPLADDGLIEIYSTRYRRTFQSTMAFLFGLVSAERWQSLTIRESHSISFCFDDCVCPLVTQLQRALSADANRQLATAQPPHRRRSAAVPPFVGLIGNTLLENPAGHLHPMEVRDAVLAVLCHGGRIPCRQPEDDDRMAGVVVPPDSAGMGGQGSGGGGGGGGGGTINQSDFINIDQDDEMSNNIAAASSDLSAKSLFSQQQMLVNRERKNIAFETINQQQPLPEDDIANQLLLPASSRSGSSAAAAAAPASCVQPSHIASLMQFTRRLRQAEHRHPDHRRNGQLRAYGLLRHLVASILRMVSGHRTKLHLYTGHDRTLEWLMAALGVTGGSAPEAASGAFIPYAARLLIEVYRSAINGDHYVRVLYNGADVTQLVDVCSGGRSLGVKRLARGGRKASLCPIENIVRFFHDDYFAAFNASNFREACQMVR